jgi:hypothetical protein
MPAAQPLGISHLVHQCPADRADGLAEASLTALTHPVDASASRIERSRPAAKHTESYDMTVSTRGQLV